jgi:hypothetical protein
VGAVDHKRCFVISPIGADNSEVREHADDVFNYIIKPALEGEYHVHRGDHEKSPGKITEQMFSNILNDDLLVAVLTFKNPNVYYELAVAQSAGRPIILLNQKGHDIPFDIKDLRIIHYDFRPKALFDGIYVELVKQAAAEVIKPNNSGFVPFDPKLPPLGTKTKSMDIFKNRGDFSSDDRDAFISGSKQTFELLSVANLQLLRTPGVKELLTGIAQQGCRMRIMIMDTNNPALPKMLNPMCSFNGVKEEIEISHATWRKWSSEFNSVDVRTVKSGMPFMSLMRNQSQALWSAYAYHGVTADCPLFRADPGSYFYSWLGREFEYLWNENAPGTDIKITTPAARKNSKIGARAIPAA